MIFVIVYYVRLRAKNQKSTFIVTANNPTCVRDLQAEHHQVERSQSCAQPLDTIRSRDSTHPGSQSNTVSQESDRRRFLNRGVRRLYLFISWNCCWQDSHNLATSSVFWKRIYTLQHIYLFSFSSSTLKSICILRKLKQTCPMRHVWSM